MPAGRRRREEVGEVLVQSAAHGGQRRRARPQRRLESVDGHGDDLVPPAEPSRLGRDPVAERAVQGGHHHVGAGQGHPAVGGQAVMGDAAMPVARVRVAQPQRGYWPTVQRRHGVNDLARGHAGKAPAGPGAEVAWPLRDHRDVGAEHVPGGEQPSMHGHGLQVPAERLPGGHGGRQPAGLLERCARAGEPGRQRPAVLHDVHHPGRPARPGAVTIGPFGLIKEAGQHGRESGMQVGHHDGHPTDVIRVPQHVMVR